MTLFQPKSRNFNYESPRVCANCKHEFCGRFCNICGEKVVENEDFGLESYLMGLIGAYTSFDGKFWKSLSTLFTDPGKISFDLSRGVTVPYMKPITFFFLANFIYFLLPYNYTFNSSLESQLTQMPYSDFAVDLVRQKMISKSLSEADLILIYGEISASLAKLLLFLLVVFLLPFLYLIAFSTKKNFATFLHLSLELSTFIILVPLVGFSIIRDLLTWILQRLGTNWDGTISDGIYSSILSFFILIFFGFALRKVMGFSLLESTLKSAVVVLSLIVVLTAFRFILFLSTLYSI
ncbi:MAG: DUF3667 domain-containing protein [Algoriphagus sp.]|jgi:hypothetical protein|nr:DUF3667 domain-containing protein [Algoriphagus sp.]